MRFVFDSSCEACPRVDPPFCCTTVSIPFAIIALFDRVLSNYVRNLKQESVISVTNTTNDFLNYRLVKNNFVFYSVFFLFLFSTSTIPPPSKSFLINGWWRSITHRLFVHCKRKEERLLETQGTATLNQLLQLSSNIYIFFQVIIQFPVSRFNDS